MDLSIRETMEALRRGRRFVTHDIWHLGLPGEQAPRGFIIKQIRVAILLARELIQDTIILRAAALTFFTILSIVPFLAVMFYIIQTFNLGDQVYETINEHISALVTDEPQTSVAQPDALGAIAPQQEQAPPLEEPPPQAQEKTEGLGEVTQDGEGAPESADPDLAQNEGNERLRNDIVAMFFRDVAQRPATAEGEPLENPVDWLITLADQGAKNQGVVNLVGLGLFLTTVFGLMANIERSFNHIWGVRSSRSWYRMFSDYLVITMLLPFMAAAVLGVTAALQNEAILESLGRLAWAVGGVQLLVIWSIFFSLYKVVPNTRVLLRYAVLGAVVAGTLWFLTSILYVKSTISLVGYNIIYSGVAQFPMLLMWVYVSWLILLFGTELSFAYQNEKTFFMERIAENASYAYKESLGLRAMIEITRRFEKGQEGVSVVHIAEEWQVPTRLVNEVLEALQTAGLVTPCASTPPTYQPGRSLSRILVGDVITAFREQGRDPSLLRSDEYFQPLFTELGHGNRPLMAMSIVELAQQYDDPPHLLEGPDAQPSEAREI